MADYIIEPLDTDAESIFLNFVEFMQVRFPDWQPSDAQLDVMIARFVSQQAAMTADMASRVMRAIFRYFGASIVQIPPLPGSPAQAEVNFVVTDGQHHVIEVGRQVGLSDENGDIQIFMLLQDVDVPADSVSTVFPGLVENTASGAVGNHLSGDVQMIELSEWIVSASVVGESSGGSDPETDENYLPRLTANLGLMSPRPILAQDFAVLALNIPGVWRAAVVDNIGGGENTLQKITSTHDADSFTLQMGANVTDDIPWDASAADVKAALSEFSNVDPYDLRVIGQLPGEITIEFIGRFGYQLVGLLTVDDSAATGGTSTGAMSIEVIDVGAAYETDVENACAISAIGPDGAPIDDVTIAALLAYFSELRTQNFLLNYIDPAYWPVDVQAEMVPLVGTEPASIATAAEGSLRAYLDPLVWGRSPYDSTGRIWLPQSTVRYLELTTVVENTRGVDYTTDLDFRITGVDGSLYTAADKVIPSLFSVVTSGVIEVDAA